MSELQGPTSVLGNAALEGTICSCTFTVTFSPDALADARRALVIALACPLEQEEDQIDL
jgi:hypothetical protein